MDIKEARLRRKIEKKNKIIKGLERKIQILEKELVSRTLDLGSLSRNIRNEVQNALCNVRMIPVGVGVKNKLIVEVQTKEQ